MSENVASNQTQTIEALTASGASLASVSPGGSWEAQELRQASRRQGLLGAWHTAGAP